MIHANIYLYNKKLADLGVKTSDVKAKITFKKEQVLYWRESILDDESEISDTHCMVYFKNSDSALIDISYNEFDKLMKTK